MIDSKYRISLDVNSTTSNVRLKCKRGDTGRTIYAALTESGYPYHITDDCYAVFTATKPDGKKVYNGCKIEGCMIVYELTPQTVAVPGLVKCEIKLYGANDKLITSASFLLEVCNAQVNDGDELESATEVEALTQLISQAVDMTVKLGTLPNFGSGAKVGDYLMVSEVDKEKRMVTVIPTDAPADLSGYAKIEQLPKNTSDLNNDSGFVTRLVADLANYYAKSETYNREEIDQKIGTIPKFSIKVVQSLPAQDINETTVYLLAEGNETGDLYSEWIYANGKWELLGSQRVDLTGYAKETWVDQKLTDYALATAVPKKVSQLQNDAGYLTEHQDISGIRSIAEEAMRRANSRLVAPQSASVGQYFRVKEVDENGFVTEVEAVDPPTGGGYGGGDLDMAGSVIDNVGSLSFNPVDDGYSQAFWIQSANDIKNDDGSHTAVAEFFSSESDGPVVLRNIADGEKDNEAVNLSQLKTRLPAPLTASVGQYIQITAIDENGLVTAVEAVDTPATPGSSGTSAEKAAELQLAAGVIAAETAANTKINTGVSLAMLKKYRRFVFVLKGATNQGLSNLYLHFGIGRKIGRSDSAGGLVYMYEWVNREESLLKATAVFQGNPSLVRAIGSSYVVNSIPSSWGNGSAGDTGVLIFNLSSAADDVTLILENGSKATIDYNWEIRGLTI